MAKIKTKATSKSQKIRLALQTAWARKLTVTQLAKRLHVNPQLIYAVKAYDGKKTKHTYSTGNGHTYKADSAAGRETEWGTPFPGTTEDTTPTETTAADFPIPMSRLDAAIGTLQRAKHLLDLVEKL
jgi:hypothetical protein